MSSISGGAPPSPITSSIASCRRRTSPSLASSAFVGSIIRPSLGAGSHLSRAHCDGSLIKHAAVSRMIRPRRGPSQPRTASPGSEYTGDDDDDDDDDAQSPIEAPPVEPSEGYAGGALADESGLAPTPRNHKSALPSLKLKLLALVAGLDRGLAAVSRAETEAVEKAVGDLEAAFAEEKPSDSDVGNAGFEEKLQGQWRLVYSSGFASTGSLGGTRPGPPAAVVPPLFKLGQVYQRIDVLAKELDNIVYLNVANTWPLPPLQVVATLAHSYTIEGDNIQIIFEKTSVKFEGSGWISQVPPFDVPQIPPEFLRPFKTLRSGTFQVTLLDDDMRITRGDRGELRVFVLA